MTHQDKLKHHAALVDHMATALGVDLEEELFRGTVLPLDVPDAVLRCTGCTDPAHCEQWVESQTAPIETPPGYCRNTTFLLSVRDTAAARGW